MLVAHGTELYLLTHAHDQWDRWSDGSGVDPAVSVESLALRTWRAGAWSAPETVAVGEPGARLYGALARDGAGRLHVIWGEARHIRGDAFHWDFAVRHRSRGTAGWSAAETLHQTRGGHGPPPNGVAAATGSDGRVHLLFEETQQQYDLHAGTQARFLVQDGASWVSQRFRVGTHLFGGVSLHRSGASGLVALYNDTGDKVQKALRFRDGRWQDPVPGGRMTWLNVDDRRGSIHAFWVDGTLRHSISESATTWSAPAQVLPPGSSLYPNQVVVIDSRNRAHLIHAGGEVRGVPGFGQARFDKGAWSVVDARPAGENFDGPAAAIDAEDRIHLVWRSGRGKEGRLYHSILDVSR
ncbi:MAG TPA: hypothetical protein VGR37_00935 [Longimicrobiaceae bacterium]|nr:hypothetical protein [Longimicrobiaceae bacterium]